MRCLETNVCAVNAASHPKEPSFIVETSFGSCNFFFSCWPLDKIFLFPCHGIWNIGCNMGHYWFRKAESVSNYLQKAAWCIKAQCSKNLNCGQQGMIASHLLLKVLEEVPLNIQSPHGQNHLYFVTLCPRSLWVKKILHETWTFSVFSQRWASALADEWKHEELRKTAW